MLADHPGPGYEVPRVWYVVPPPAVPQRPMLEHTHVYRLLIKMQLNERFNLSHIVRYEVM